MKSKNAKKGSKNDKVKRNVQTMKKAPGKHSKEEIISEEELDNRIAIDGDIRLYFTMYSVHRSLSSVVPPARRIRSMLR